MMYGHITCVFLLIYLIGFYDGNVCGKVEMNHHFCVFLHTAGYPFFTYATLLYPVPRKTWTSIISFFKKIARHNPNCFSFWSSADMLHMTWSVKPVSCIHPTATSNDEKNIFVRNTLHRKSPLSIDKILMTGQYSTILFT